MNDVVQEVLALMRSDLLSRQVNVSTELANELPLFPATASSCSRCC